MSMGTPESALRAYIGATNTHDFDNVRRLLHPDAVFWFGDATCESPEAVRAYFENAWRAVEDEMYAATDVRWIAVGPAVAACTYTYTYRGHHDGTAVSGRGRATNVFSLDGDGRWRLAHEHLSPCPS